jgi:RND family efflux transporter MFP subunit
MKIKKYIIRIFIVVGSIGIIAATLANNKEELKEDAKIAALAAEAIPVYTTALKNENIDRQIVATGCLKAHKELMLLSETQGRVNNIYKRKGDKVRKGEVITSVEDEVFLAQKLVAEANFEQAEKDLKRSEKLRAGNAISKQRLEQARIAVKQAKAQMIAAKKQYDNTSIEAPFSGEIINDFIETGTLLAGGMQICEIVDIAQLKMIVKVTEREVLEIVQGDQVEIKVNALPEQSFVGTVKSISSKADNAMKFDVEIRMHNNGESQLRAGMYADVRFNSSSKERMNTIDRKAIVGGLKSPKVFVIKEGKAYNKAIVIGRAFNDKIEVISGIDASEQIVLSGQINLKEGTEVKVLQ